MQFQNEIDIGYELDLFQNQHGMQQEFLIINNLNNANNFSI
jgi:hypothetical protein